MIINQKEVKINRENIRINECDIAYCSLIKQILDTGVETKNRTGINTISISGWSYKFNVGEQFPVNETKDVKVKNCTSEIQWIHTVQSNEVKWLQDRDNHTWDLWVVDKDGIYRTYEQGDGSIIDPERKVPVVDIYNKQITDKYGNPLMTSSFVDGKTIKTAKYFGEQYAGTIGEAYGYINNLYKRPQYVEETIKNNPFDRRMVVSLWQDAHLAKAVLPSCVWSCEYKVSADGKVNSFVHQRSADVPLGLPFNITQYAILLCMYAKACGLKPGTMDWSIMDAHIYINQIPGIKKQLNRFNYMEEYVSIIQNSTDEEVERLYNKICEEFNLLEIKAINLLNEDIRNIKMSQRINKIKKIDEKLAILYEISFERKTCFEHLVTRENPVLELASHDSIFEYSTDFVKKDDPYLKENPIGNRELVLKKYTPTPFISMPIAQ